MYRIALVQNQSEMAHYGYADARPIFHGLGYETDLFTADNIDGLRLAICRNEYDAIVLGSNALNDKTIRAETSTREFQESFREWLLQGRGLLCLNQLRLASLDNPNLGFLPSPIDSISAAIRPDDERSADGTLGYGPNAKQQLLLLYPHGVSPKIVQEAALNFQSLPGLYWHYWENAGISDWEVLIEDVTAPGEGRPLLLSARSQEKYRVVVSSLPLDWHNQSALLENTLTYVVEGRHSTAVLRDAKSRNSAFEYLLGTLRSQKFPFHQYSPNQNLERLMTHLENGVHTVLVLGPFVDLKDFPELLELVEKLVAVGSLELVSVEDEASGSRRFSVSGRQRSALNLLYAVELHIQGELREGYIDGSFWSTAESLQALEALPQAKSVRRNAVSRALELAGKHDRHGSYDEVFGASCALLWMRGTYLGVDSREAAATAAWLRKRLEIHEPREQALAYLTLSRVGMMQEEEKTSLISLLRGLKANQLSENDLVVYLQAALLCSLLDVLPGLLQSLKEKQDGGAWIDLATTADAVSTLLQVRRELQASPTPHFDLVSESIEEMVFQGIINIQEAYVISLAKKGESKLPWDGKTSTTVKCIQAWLDFEEFVSFPVQELVGVIEKSSEAASIRFPLIQSLSVLEAMKADREELRGNKMDLEARIRNLQPTARRASRYFLGFCAVTYLLLTLVGGAIVSGGTSIAAILHASFVSGWPLHAAIIGSALTLLTIPWAQLLRKVRNARSAKKD